MEKGAILLPGRFASAGISLFEIGFGVVLGVG
jgi:hypothetical protein